MNITFETTMIPAQVKLFWKEIEQIQARHLLFFPEEQKQQIRLVERDGRTTLCFSETYELSSTITLEIQFAFKMVATLTEGHIEMFT